MIGRTVKLQWLEVLASCARLTNMKVSHYFLQLNFDLLRNSNLLSNGVINIPKA